MNARRHGLMHLCQALIFQCLFCCAQEPEPEWAPEVDAIAKQALARPTAGLSIAVARDGKLIFARGYGMANVEHSVPVTPETVFHLASISKNIESAVLLQLIDQGKVRLEDDVKKHLPEAPTHGHKVTVKQLLNNTSGIHSFTSLPEASENERRDLTHAQVLDLIRNKPMDFKPGTSWRYDNTAFYMAGMIIEKVTGQEYGAYVREHLFQPLGMSSATLGYAQTVLPHLASGYQVEDGKLVHADYLTWKLPFAAGAICATATDLVKWPAALESGKVLRPETLALMRTPTTLTDGTKIDYGLGTRLGSLQGHPVVGHTGGGGGFRTVMATFPEKHLTIAVLANTEDAPSIPIAAAIARLAFGLPEERLLDLPVPQEELDGSLGTFDSDDGMIRVFARDGKLRGIPSNLTGEGTLMRRQAPYTYALDGDHVIRCYPRNGKVEWGVLYSGGLMMDPKRRVH
jgi:CubicO group peptidase (beta-lactamase class C family)